MPTSAELLTDLAAETADLDDLVAGLTPERWNAATPAPGWTIAHQIAHLAWTDEIALLAATSPSAFTAELHEGLSGAESVPALINGIAAEGAKAAPDELLARWRAGSTKLTTALADVPPGTKLPWLGPPMSASSMATARLMETWAHGQDVADALGIRREPTARLRHVAHIGVRAMGYAFAVNDRPVPADVVRVELLAPGGDNWTWGDREAVNRVTGTALDFCHLATQRRHRQDLELVAEGPVANEWLDIAQAFAGPPGTGRAAGQYPAEATVTQ